MDEAKRKTDMERLTERVGEFIRIKGCKTLYASEERKGAYLYNAIVRLAKYEDVGLEPKEIIGLCDMDKRAKMADMLRLEEYQALGPIAHLRELVEAEQDGRCVVAGMDDKCKTCVHNMDKSNLDCEYACAGVSETDGNGIVFACDDYKATQQGCGNG